MQAAIGENGRARPYGDTAFRQASVGQAQARGRGRYGDAPQTGGLRLLAVAMVTVWLAACQTTSPVPVEVRTAPGSTPSTAPAPATAPEVQQPDGGIGGVSPAGPVPGTSPIGPSGQPLRTEPYGLKRGYGDPPRQAAVTPGGAGMGAGGATPSGAATGVGQAPAAGTGTMGTGVGVVGAGAPGTAAAAGGGTEAVVAPPIAAPTVLPPASSLEQKPPVSLVDPGAGAAGAGAGGAPGQPGSGQSAPGQPPAAVATAPATAATASGSGTLDGVRFGWPLKGKVLQDFGQTSGRGLSLGARPKAAVAAAADGKVIFSGAGPREYGNLIIVKHAGDLLSVYANNSSLAVKEGQDVRRGQKIAEAGSATNTPQLHFEIRQQGKPIDPLTVLQPQ